MLKNTRKVNLFGCPLTLQPIIYFLLLSLHEYTILKSKIVDKGNSSTENLVIKVCQNSTLELQLTEFMELQINWNVVLVTTSSFTHTTTKIKILKKYQIFFNNAFIARNAISTQFHLKSKARAKGTKTLRYNALSIQWRNGIQKNKN